MKRSPFPLIVTVLAFALGMSAQTSSYPDFALGADVSWTNYIQEELPVKYYKSATGNALTTIPEMVGEHGIDAVRLRVWVNPKTATAKKGFSYADEYGDAYTVATTHGRCDAEDLLSMAKTYSAQGQRVMVCFHLSDVWADPARQFIPSAWSDCTTADALSERVNLHIAEVLSALREAGVNVAWVQIGNETNSGMLKYQLPSSSTAAVTPVSHGCELWSHADNFVRVWKSAAKMVRAVCPRAKTVLHLAQATLWEAKLQWILKQLTTAGLTTADCDYIGLSLYPGVDDGTDDATADWQRHADAAIATINSIYTTYGWRTLLAEVGMNNEYSASTTATSQAANIAQCNADVAAFTQYLIDRLSNGDNAKSPSAATCDGLFYWQPEGDYIDGYKKGACVDRNPGRWSRTALVPNSWWATVKANSTFEAATPHSPTLQGDMDGDGKITMSDANSIVNIYLGQD